jgi:hypothetical protein
VSQELANAVAEKQKRDERQYSEYVSKGTPTVAVVTRTDGGMHPAFAAAFQKPYSDASGVIRAPGVSTPGTIPAHAVPPRAAEGGATGSTGSAVVASAGDAGGSSGNLFGGLFASNNTEPSNSEGVLDRMSRFVGWKASDPAPAPAPAQTKKSQPKSTQTAATAPKAPVPKNTATSSATTTAAAPSGASNVTNAGAIRPVAPKPSTPEAKPEQRPEATPEAKAAADPRPSSSAGLLNGAQPPVTGSFNNRWGSF